jgi:hypothetical protein
LISPLFAACGEINRDATTIATTRPNFECSLANFIGTFNPKGTHDASWKNLLSTRIIPRSIVRRFS